MVGNTQKLDALIDGKLADDLDSAYIFSKVIGHKISDGYRNDLYLRCRVKFAADIVQTQSPPFMDLGIPTINTLDERGVLGTPATRIQRPTDVYHWSASYHVFVEATAVVMSAEKSYHDYNYKTDFDIWGGNQEFERQNIPMSQPRRYSTTIGRKKKNTKTSHLDLTPGGTKISYPKPLTQPTESSKCIVKYHISEDPESDLSSSDTSSSESDLSDDSK